ncbi:sensor histidine kinase [Noviherbaspirillum pedocola]|uniref:histidine kinase n=1 Tax=Noviherbaspirillum pedocola TaxID=2801341 RepID=A0A934T020_9BURK|nr:sensor histidine kinase [Noviherbaspirillum pedocola]MBK4734888.1 sensor histidine kinase N-terminal domain-containing protein [Noviherbaspirillum pedocola]
MDRAPQAASALQEDEETTQRSLFGEILDWMLVPLLLLWPLSIAITYLVAKNIANQPFDRELEDKVTVLAQQVKLIDGRIAVGLPAAARDMLRADEIDAVSYQVLGPRGELLDGELDMPVPVDDEDRTPWAVTLRYDTMRNADVRIAYVYVGLPPQEGGIAPRQALVQVAETLDKRADLANQIIKGVILPEFIILPVALALVWFALSRGLSPLAELQRQLRARRSEDLSPIDTSHVPEEITPLVGSLNAMLEKVSQSIEMQKRFIADAAHQMKTPLAGMRMQSELALRQTSAEEIHRSLEQLAKSSESATRLVNQLLALARAENQTPQASPFVPVELSELARNVVHDWVQLAFARGIDIGFEQPEHPLLVAGNPTMLRELLGNLIDNALRYTPANGSVTVRVRADLPHELAILEVEDTGPGIAPAERGHVFERFYRILGSHTEGSGLGLAIVREIAQQHGAEVEILANPQCRDRKLPGTLLRVTLPMRQRPDQLEDYS